MMADRDIILEIEQKRRFGNLSGVQLSEKLLAAVGLLFLLLIITIFAGKHNKVFYSYRLRISIIRTTEVSG